MKAPLVSVIMSVYNSEKTLKSALDSIRAQTYENWELVVCDDASTDGTIEVLRQFCETVAPSRVIVLRNEENKKLAFSLNRCLNAASGDLIARMDADDVSEPDRLEQQVRYLASNPSVDLVGTAMRRFSAEGVGEVIPPVSLAPDRWALSSSSGVPFFHATIMARSYVFSALGNYTVSWRTERGQDVDLWFKFFAAGLAGRNLPSPLYNVREDAAAVRRRTAKARFGGFVTRIKGNWMLRYPARAYFTALFNLLKIVVPYRVFDWQRNLARRRALRGSSPAEVQR